MMGRGRREGLGLRGYGEIDYNLSIEELKTVDLDLLKRNLARKERRIIKKVFGSNMTGVDHQERQLDLPDGRRVVLSLCKPEEMGNVEEIIEEADLKYSLKSLEIELDLKKKEGAIYYFGSRLLIGRDLFFFSEVKTPAAVRGSGILIESEDRFGSLDWKKQRRIYKEYGRVLKEIWKVVRRE